MFVSTPKPTLSVLVLLRRARTASRTCVTVFPDGARSSFAVVSLTTSIGIVCANCCAMYEYLIVGSPTTRIPRPPRCTMFSWYPVTVGPVTRAMRPFTSTPAKSSWPPVAAPPPTTASFASALPFPARPPSRTPPACSARASRAAMRTRRERARMRDTSLGRTHFEERLHDDLAGFPQALWIDRGRRVAGGVEGAEVGRADADRRHPPAQ